MKRASMLSGIWQGSMGLILFMSHGRVVRCVLFLKVKFGVLLMIRLVRLRFLRNVFKVFGERFKSFLIGLRCQARNPTHPALLLISRPSPKIFLPSLGNSLDLAKLQGWRVGGVGGDADLNAVLLGLCC